MAVKVAGGHDFMSFTRFSMQVSIRWFVDNYYILLLLKFYSHWPYGLQMAIVSVVSVTWKSVFQQMRRHFACPVARVPNKVFINSHEF